MSDTPAGNESQGVPPPEVNPYVPPMKSSDAVNAILGHIVKGYSAAALLGLLLFFLPWVNVSCQGVTLVSQTGLQLVQGDFTENENAGKELDKQLDLDIGSSFEMSTRSIDERKFPVVNNVRFDEFGYDDSADSGKDDVDSDATPKDGGVLDSNPIGGEMSQPGGMSLELSPEQDNKAKIKKMREETGPFFLAVGAPVGFLLAGVLGLVTLVTKSPSNPFLPLVGGAIALLSLLAIMVIKLPIETAMFADVPPGMDISHTIWFFLALLLALLVLAGTIVQAVVGCRCLAFARLENAAKSAQQQLPSK